LGKDFEEGSQHLPGETEEVMKNLSGQSVNQPIFDMDISRI
jgi:hypothetical protein